MIFSRMVFAILWKPIKWANRTCPDILWTGIFISKEVAQEEALEFMERNNIPKAKLITDEVAYCKGVTLEIRKPKKRVR